MQIIPIDGDAILFLVVVACVVYFLGVPSGETKRDNKNMKE